MHWEAGGTTGGGVGEDVAHWGEEGGEEEEMDAGCSGEEGGLG